MVEDKSSRKEGFDMAVKTDLVQAVVELRYSDVGDLVRDALRAGITPARLLDELRAGLAIVGEKYHNREYFLSELYMAGETMQAAMDVLIPALSKVAQPGSEGTVVIGSIQGDIHDFGKTIASSFLKASGFKVYDLGTDVPPAKFVDEAQRVDADVIGISAILSSTQPTTKEVVDVLKAWSLRDRFKVILGGTGVTKQAIEMYGVDAAVNDAPEGVRIIKEWMEVKKRPK